MELDLTNPFLLAMLAVIYYTASMLFSHLLFTTGLVSLHGTALAAPPLYPHSAAYNRSVAIRSGPFVFPLANGFPDPSPAVIETIEEQAHGTLPNSTLSPDLSNDSATVFQLIAFNELFEVAFFADLIANMTYGLDGYRMGDKGIETNHTYEHALRSLHVILAQEELHALGANAVLHAAGYSPIVPCKYTFPSSTFHEAITFAAAFTDVVLGTLQEAIHQLAVDGDYEYTGLIASVIGQEGEQDGFFRLRKSAGMEDPSALPFLTASSGILAYSALNQLVIVPGSCPNMTAIEIPILPPLNVLSADHPGGSATFSISKYNMTTMDSLNLVYINQQNLPIVAEMANFTHTNTTMSFSAALPDSLSGLTLAALTKQPGPFASASEVAAAAVYGPGVIEF